MRDVPASTRSADDVEVVTRLRWVVWINGDHDSLENIQGGKTADTTAIETEKIQIPARHFSGSRVDACVVAVLEQVAGEA